MRHIALLCSFFFSVLASGEAPDVVLSQVDNYLGEQSFSQSFQTGDRVVIRMDENFNSISSETVTSEEIEALNSVAKSTLRSADGRVIRVDQLTLTDWKRFRGSFARHVIQQLIASGYSLDLQITDIIEARVMRNGRPARLGALKISYNGINAMGSQIEGELTVTNGLPGRAQVVVRRENQAGVVRVWSVLSFDRL